MACRYYKTSTYNIKVSWYHFMKLMCSDLPVKYRNRLDILFQTEVLCRLTRDIVTMSLQNITKSSVPKLNP